MGWGPNIGFAASALFHVGLAASVLALPEKEERAPTAIQIREIKPPKRAEVPKEMNPPPETPAPKAPTPKKVKPAPVAEAPAAEAPASAGASEAPPDFGLQLGGGTGGGGMAVPAAGGSGDRPPARETEKAKPKALGGDGGEGGGCAEPLVKAKPQSVVQPAYTDEAREAGISGKVRVEISISETGQVTAAKVLAGLGHGLDEAALEAARASTFTPATRCGKPVATTFTIGMRFTL